MSKAGPDFPDSPIRLLIASAPAHLPVVRAAVERVCELMGFDEQNRDDIVLAVDEALANVIKHAYHGASDRPIEITLRSIAAARPGSPKSGGGTALRIELRDWGDQTEPARIKSRDLGDVRPGGLGVHIMKRCMDEVKYAHAPEGGTFLTMVKAM